MGTQDAADPRQMWEAGARAMSEGLKQAQEFWTQAARGWSDAASAWAAQLARPAAGAPDEGMAVLRELSEASFAVSQAWMRLPTALMTGAPPAELQAALTRLMQAQGRAYQLWIEFLGRAARPGR